MFLINMNDLLHYSILNTHPPCINFFTLIYIFINEKCPDRDCIGHVCTPAECEYNSIFTNELCKDELLPQCHCSDCSQE